MRQQTERPTARALGGASWHHNTLLLVLLCVLVTAGCASQNARPAHDTLQSQSAATGSQSSRDSANDSNAGRDSDHSHPNGLKTALKNYYKQWKGVPYAYGGRSQDGVDCSSFVRHTYDAVESYELPRTTVQQAHLGMSVNRSNLETGDLVFFKTGGGSHHVGIYLGQRRFMHASSSDGVTISRLDNSYWRRHYWQSRRIITDTP